jgi:hypothetical protein
MSSTLELKVDLLNEKCDRMILMFEKLISKRTPVKESSLNEWSVEEYNNSALIKFSFNNEFKDFIKELGGTWINTKKAWVFSKDGIEDIIEQVQDKYPKWSFTNSLN